MVAKLACLSYQAVKQSPAAAPLHPWVWPSRPWKQVHVDFAGPFMGKMFLLDVDAHSKWGEVYPMLRTTTIKTMRHNYVCSIWASGTTGLGQWATICVGGVFVNLLGGMK